MRSVGSIVLWLVTLVVAAGVAWSLGGGESARPPSGGLDDARLVTVERQVAELVDRLERLERDRNGVVVPRSRDASAPAPGRQRPRDVDRAVPSAARSAGVAADDLLARVVELEERLGELLDEREDDELFGLRRHAAHWIERASGTVFDELPDPETIARHLAPVRTLALDGSLEPDERIDALRALVEFGDVEDDVELGLAMAGYARAAEDEGVREELWDALHSVAPDALVDLRIATLRQDGDAGVRATILDQLIDRIDDPAVRAAIEVVARDDANHELREFAAEVLREHPRR